MMCSAAVQRGVGRGRACARGVWAFTLVELLVVIAVVGVLVALIVPALAGARAAGRDVACAANLRQNYAICLGYANDNKGRSPALGQPYGSVPNWCFVVMESQGRTGGASDIYVSRVNSSLVCPGTRVELPDVQRSYAINATGHNKNPFSADPDDYDEQPVSVRMDLVANPSAMVLLLDSARIPDTPATRTASVLDWRLDEHVRQRVGRVHAGHKRFNAVRLDGSGGGYTEPVEAWLQGLP